MTLRNSIVERRFVKDQQWDLVELPDGGRLIYVEVPGNESSPVHHSYWLSDENWRRGKRLTGGSTLAKPYSFDSGRLLSWKERVTCEGVAALVGQFSDGFEQKRIVDPEWLLSGEAIRAKLKEASLLADDHRDRKATIGTNVHTVLEGLAGVCPVPNVDELPEEEKGYARAVMRWWEYRQPHVLHAEQFVYSAAHGYAGRFDLRASSGADVPDPFIRLIDLKTSSWIAPSHHVQLRLYDIAARECGVGASDELLILKVTPEGKFYEIPCRATEADALHAIAVYRGAARIERESGLPRAA